MNIILTIQVSDNSGKSSKEELKESVFQQLFFELIQSYQKRYDIREITDDKIIKFVQKEELFFTPRVGEYYQINKILFLVVGVEHNLSTGASGTIFVKKTNKILQTFELAKQ